MNAFHCNYNLHYTKSSVLYRNDTGNHKVTDTNIIVCWLEVKQLLNFLHLIILAIGMLYHVCAIKVVSVLYVISILLGIITLKARCMPGIFLGGHSLRRSTILIRNLLWLEGWPEERWDTYFVVLSSVQTFTISIPFGVTVSHLIFTHIK